MNEGMGVIAPGTGKVYYTGKYWNDFPAAVAEINRRATGDPKTVWYDHFFKNQGHKFNKVLMLNCGNGWVEREMHDKGYFGGEVVGVDFADDLLEEARQKASKLPFRYYKMDINTAKFPEGDFDLVINHAAGHHIAKVNKVFTELLRIMTGDGVFLNYDYVGPHRNQYPIDQWHAAHQLNQTLPNHVRQALSYPHLPTMLVTDPSEAIHAELILPVMRRYFDFDFFKPVGGALAYLLLTHNQAIQKASKPDVLKTVKAIMAADGTYHDQHPEHTMFAYWAGKPRKAELKNTEKLRDYQKEEDEREKRAAQQGGHYYDLNLIQQLYQELDDLRIAKQHKQSTIEELQKENDALRAEIQKLQDRTVRRRAARLMHRAKHTIARPAKTKA
jgi:SAM-dependent methyltransferase